MRCDILVSSLCFQMSADLHPTRRWTERFDKARTTTGSWAALERSYKEDDGGYGATGAVPREEGGDGGGEVGICTLDELIMFDAPAFLPNVFSVTSWVEYEGLATFLWITKVGATRAVLTSTPFSTSQVVECGLCTVFSLVFFT